MDILFPSKEKLFSHSHKQIYYFSEHWCMLMLVGAKTKSTTCFWYKLLFLPFSISKEKGKTKTRVRNQVCATRWKWKDQLLHDLNLSAPAVLVPGRQLQSAHLHRQLVTAHLHWQDMSIRSEQAVTRTRRTHVMLVEVDVGKAPHAQPLLQLPVAALVVVVSEGRLLHRATTGRNLSQSKRWRRAGLHTSVRSRHRDH